MTTAEILTRAKDRIETVGFWQANKPGSSGVCALLAVDDVVRHDRRTLMSVLSVLAPQMGCQVDEEDIARWNNAHTRAEVLGAFDAAIEAAS